MSDRTKAVLAGLFVGFGAVMVLHVDHPEVEIWVLGISVVLSFFFGLFDSAKSRYQRLHHCVSWFFNAVALWGVLAVVADQGLEMAGVTAAVAVGAIAGLVAFAVSAVLD